MSDEALKKAEGALGKIFLKDEKQPPKEPEKPKIELMQGENIVKVLKPHFLAFWDMYLIWVWVILLSVVFMLYGQALVDYTFNPLKYFESTFEQFFAPTDNAMLKAMPLIPAAREQIYKNLDPAQLLTSQYSVVSLWITALVLSSFVVSVFKIEFKWVAIMVGIGVVSGATTYYLDAAPEVSFYLGILYSLIGMVLVEIYRQAHIFYITNYRIVTEVDFLHHKKNELSYDKINNCVMDQSVVGSIFNFGTVIPVTASGLGMGTDYAEVSLGAAGQKGGWLFGGQVTGGRSIQTPRVRSMYALYGVVDPEDIQKIVTTFLHEYVQAPYLKKVNEQLDQLRDVYTQGMREQSQQLDNVEGALQRLIEQKHNIEEEINIAKQKFYNNELTEESFKEIALDNQKKLIELERKIKELEQRTRRA